MTPIGAAQTAIPASTNGALDAIIQTGVVGALLALAIFALWKLYARIIANADAERAAREKAEAELRELHREIRTEVLTVLADATHAISLVAEQQRKELG